MIWHSSTAKEVLDNFNVNADSGLNTIDATHRLEKYKENEIHDYKKENFLKILCNEAISKFNIALFCLATIYLLLSIATKYNGSLEAVVILILCIIRVLLKSSTKFFTNKHLNKYCISINSFATVIRDSEEMKIPANQLVPGDIVLVKEGDYIPADARLVDSYVLKCDEFALTGEEVPVDKFHDSIYDDITPISKRYNMIYCGTNVINGQATAVVTGTGAFTEISKAESINQIANSSETPLSNTINQIEKIITTIAMSTSLLIFFITLLVNFNSSNVSFAINVIEKILLSLAFFSTTSFGFLSSYLSLVTSFGAKRFEESNVVPVDISVTEKLKDISVICTDKSGVITSNKMSVVKVYNGVDTVDLKNDEINDGTISILRLALVCSNLDEVEHYEKHANSMEKAIEEACVKFSSVSKTDIDGVYPKLCELPFAHDRRLMTIVTVINGKPYAIVKGAPEVIASRSLRVNEEELNKISNDFAEDGLKVISIAMKPLSEIPANPNSDQLENGLTFVGTIGIEDPINKDIVSIIKDCKSLNKKIIMLTGDHISTAISVAKKVGILTNNEQAISCSDLSDVSDEQLSEQINNFTVFARATSNDKLRIVRILKEQGEKVLVTGDSTNDSYALREADIGCSMGLTATDMVNYSADMVITDNKFSSIFSAICESYRTTQNIKKGIHLILTCSFIQLILILLGTLIFSAIPFSISGLLMFNTLFIGLLSAAFAAEKHKKMICHKSTENLLDINSIISFVVPAVIISIFSLLTFSKTLEISYNSAISTTFLMLTIGLIAHCLSINSDKFLLSTYSLNFRTIPLAALILIILTLIITISPVGAAFFFKSVATESAWLILICVLCVIVSDELLKYFLNRNHR